MARIRAIVRRLTALVIGNSARTKTGYDRIFPPFNRGLAPARKDGVWFHVRPDGTRAYTESYDWVLPFNEGLAPVKKDGVWFHIRPDGSRAYAESYSHVGEFRGGVAFVVDYDDKPFYIRPDGTRVS